MAEPKKILLVEDDPHDVELTLIALEKIGLAGGLIVTRDGAEALDYLFRREAYAARKDGMPAAVLLDIKLPKVDGIEVLRIIKSDAALKMLPVVMLTSSREDRDLEACYKEGANAFVVKPVGFAEFEEAISKIWDFWSKLNEPPPRPS